MCWRNSFHSQIYGGLCQQKQWQIFCHDFFLESLAHFRERVVFFQVIKRQKGGQLAGDFWACFRWRHLFLSSVFFSSMVPLSIAAQKDGSETMASMYFLRLCVIVQLGETIVRRDLVCIFSHCRFGSFGYSENRVCELFVNACIEATQVQNDSDLNMCVLFFLKF